MNKKKIYQHLYFQVLTAISIGVCVGHFYPETGAAMKPLGDGFIKLIKMIIAPVIFCTVVTGIAGMEDMKKVGRVGAKALLYFEIVTTLALVIGLLVVSVIQPGVGMNADVTKLDTKALTTFTAQAKSHSMVDFCHEHHPQQRGGCLCQGGHPPGAALRHPVRLCAVHARRHAARRSSS